MAHKIPSTDPGRLWGLVNSLGASLPTPQPCQSLLCPGSSTLYSHTPSLWVSISNPTLPWICFICGHQYPPHAKPTDLRLKELVVPASQWHVTLMASLIVWLSLSLASTMPTLSSILLLSSFPVPLQCGCSAHPQRLAPPRMMPLVLSSLSAVPGVSFLHPAPTPSLHADRPKAVCPVQVSLLTPEPRTAPPCRSTPQTQHIQWYLSCPVTCLTPLSVPHLSHPMITQLSRFHLEKRNLCQV